MKKMMQYLRLSFICCLALVVFAGCQPDSWSFVDNVTFSASTGYDNLPGTKTVYGDDVTIGGTTYERIDWVSGDKIRVMAHNVRTTASTNNNYADYKVNSGNTHDGRNSKATVVKDGELGLNWRTTTETSDTFYAIYPSPAVNSNASISVVTGYATIGGSIPASQSYTTLNMNNAYMWAAETASNTTATIDLKFKPAFTAFQITINNDTSAPFTITSFELSSTSSVLTGSFTGTITAGGTPSFSTTGTNKKITVTNLPTTAIAVGGNASVTLFALPLDLTNMSIKVTIVSGSTTVTKTLDLKKDGSFMPFDKCKKYRINVGAPAVEEPWTYVVEDIENISLYGHLASPNNAFTVKSYRYRGSEYEPVKWKVQYATSASGPWSDTQPTSWGINGAKFSINTTTGNGSVPSSTGEARLANIVRDHLESEKTTEGIDSEQAAIAVLRGRGTLPSSGTGYFDLSKHPIYPVSAIDGAEIAQETANCYVITRPGKYKFPLVYGNAIRNGVANQMAYAPQGLSANNDIVYFLRRFVRHDDKPIVDPWLKNNGATPTDAVVVWQDVTDASMQILLDSDISVDADYVYFEIKSERIRPGNILIAARQSGTIVWSWHIWVTEKDLTPHTVVDKNNVSHSMMTYNLGWTDKSSAHGEHWNDWKFYIRVVQTDDYGNVLTIGSPINENGTGAADVFSVIQYGESIHVDSNVGSNTFYQWGRKDPILGAASNNTNKRVYSAVYSLSDIVESNSKVVTVRNDAGTIGQSIKTPYKIFYSRASQTIGTQSGNITSENHMFIGKATDNNGETLAGAAWYGNLWDTGLIAHIGTSTSANALSVNNRLPIKSVYDPSPRGYVVPYTFAFTSFSNAAWNDNHANTPRGSITSDGEGYNFNDGNGGSIFLPFAGARGGDGVNPLYDVNTTMYYWTTGKLPWDDKWGSMNKSKNMSFYRDGHTTTSPEIWAINDQYSEGAYSVRPVLETASASSSSTFSVTGEGLSGGWDH